MHFVVHVFAMTLLHVHVHTYNVVVQLLILVAEINLLRAQA